MRFATVAQDVRPGRRLPLWVAAACVAAVASQAGAADRAYGGGRTLTIARSPIAGIVPHSHETGALVSSSAEPARRARRAYPDVLLPGGRATASLDRSWSLLPSARHARAARLASRNRRGPNAAFELPLLCIRVDFLRDSLGLHSTGDGRFDLRPYVDANGDTVDVPIDPPPHNRDYFRAHMAALDRYYDAQSHGEVRIRSEVFPAGQDSAYHLPDVGRYGPWLLFSGYNPFATAQAFVRDAIRAAAEDPTIPWGDYALDGREVRVVIFHAGPDLQSDIEGDSPRDLPSFFIGMEDSVAVAGGAYYVKYATVAPETASQDDAYGALNGVLAHETGHQLGLPDLYNTQIGTPAVGFWSLMDSGNLVAGPTEDPRNGATIFVSGIIPPSLDAWSKAALFPERFLRGGFAPSLSDTLSAIQNEPAILQVPISASEYFLLENRQTDVNGDDSIFVETDSVTHVIMGPKAGRGDAPPLPEYDALLPGSGIIVWHVDEEQLFRLLDNGFSVNDDPSRPAVAVVEADGTYDLGDFGAFPYTIGSPWDPFYAGNRDVIASYTSPSTRSRSGGDSHITIRVPSKNGLRMAVEVTQEWLLPGFPFPLPDDTLGTGSPVAVDLFGDGSPWILVAASDKIAGVLWQDIGGGTIAPIFGGGVFARSSDGSAFRDEIAFAAGAFGGSDATANALAATTRSGDLYVWNGAGQRVQRWPGLPRVTSAPSFLGSDLLVGCEDGRVHRLSMTGGFVAIGPSLGAPVVGAPRSVSVGGDSVLVWTAANGSMAVWESGTVRVTPLATTTAWQPRVTIAYGGAGGCDILVADRSGTVWRLDRTGTPVPGWPVSAGDSIHGSPVSYDIDLDGEPEVVVMTEDGVVHAFNDNASRVRLWPQQGDVEAGDGGVTTSSPLVADIRLGGTRSLITAMGSGNVVARPPGEAPLDGWPLSVSASVHSTPTFADVTGDGVPEAIVVARDGVMYVYDTRAFAADTRGETYIMEGHDPARTGAMAVVTSPPNPSPSAPLLSSVYMAPSPARLSETRSITIGYTLPAGASDVRIEVFDVTGKRVADVDAPATGRDNRFVWSLEDVAPGMYLCKMTVRSGTRSEEHVAPMAVQP